MELSRSNTKKILTFSQKKAFLILSQKKTFLLFSKKKAFLIFLEMELCTFHLQAREIKKTHSGKIAYTSGNENPEQFDIFQETETLKKLLIFQEVPCKA